MAFQKKKRATFTGSLGSIFWIVCHCSDWFLGSAHVIFLYNKAGELFKHSSLIFDFQDGVVHSSGFWSISLYWISSSPFPPVTVVRIDCLLVRHFYCLTVVVGPCCEVMVGRYILTLKRSTSAFIQWCSLLTNPFVPNFRLRRIIIPHFFLVIANRSRWQVTVHNKRTSL